MKYIYNMMVCIAISSVGFAQDRDFKKIENKGKFFLYWGWNRGFYSDSDISFKGDDYDFRLAKVKSKDKPSPFSFDKYLNPANMTIPQTNYRIGYFFKENYTISLGVDHMKYVMIQDQTVEIDGSIDPSYGFPFDDTIVLSEDFLQFEHTDGLNYVCVEVSRFDDISHVFGLYAENFQINLTEGLGVGFLFPKTNSTLLGKERYDDFHVSGYGVSGRVGLDFTIYKYFFLMSELKGGFIDMGDIRTTQSTADSASQNFWYVQPTFVFGAKFRLFK